jgi:dTDP-4-dehydrorhamnose reductase
MNCTNRDLSAYNASKGIYHLDLEENLDNLESYSYDFVIITAGITNIKLCEEYPDYTKRVNVENTIQLISKLLDANSHVIYLSSNVVFPEDIAFPSIEDKPDPRNSYGAQKLAVESFLKTNPGNWTVLRLTKVLGENFELLGKWSNDLQMKREIHAFEDVMLSPITLLEVEEALKVILDHNARGLFQLGGTAEYSYYEFAKIYFQDNPNASKLIIPAVKEISLTITHNSLKTFLPGY